METIGGVEIFPLISFLIFFVFFIGLFTWVMKMKKTEVNMLAQLPFEDKTQENETTNI